MGLLAYGLGVGTKNRQAAWLEVWFPAPRLGEADRDVAKLLADAGWRGGNAVVEVAGDARARLAAEGHDATARALAAGKRPMVLVALAADSPPASVPEAYLKLHLLSHRLVKPHGTNLSGIFKVLPNVAWTSQGPVDPEELPAAMLAARAAGQTLTVRAIDKFPALVDYVVPAGVRIADGARVRLGAALGPGTTVMHEGFVNFNAGTEGPNMVEGRISAGVTIGPGTDLGGGCSTMGTLSGGGDVVISVGRNCLIGANAGLGIPLGDDCTIESGLYLTAASKVRVLGRDGVMTRVIKARELAGRSGLLFRRNSQTGAIECLPNPKAAALNEDLHAHN